MDRLITSFPKQLLGSYVNVNGIVHSIRYKNPFTRSKNIHRQKMFLLKSVMIADKQYDHLWIFGVKKLRDLKVGDKISICGYLKSYYHNGVRKMRLGFPYKRIRE